jgi:hypothetical protein
MNGRPGIDVKWKLSTTGNILFTSMPDLPFMDLGYLYGTNQPSTTGYQMCPCPA